MKFSVLYSSCTVKLPWDLHIDPNPDLQNCAVVKLHGEAWLATMKLEFLPSVGHCYPEIRPHHPTFGHGANERLIENCDFKLRAVIPPVVAIPILPFWQISLAAYCFKSFHVHFHRQTSWNFVAMSAKIPNFIGNCSSSRGCPGKILPIYLAFSGVRCDPQVRKSAANREQGLHWFSTVKFWGTDQLQSAMFQLRLEIEAT